MQPTHAAYTINPATGKLRFFALTCTATVRPGSRFILRPVTWTAAGYVVA